MPKVGRIFQTVPPAAFFAYVGLWPVGPSHPPPLYVWENHLLPPLPALQVPTADADGAPIPQWKREMMAKKAADKARGKAVDRRSTEIEAQKMSSLPEWKRQIMERRQEDQKRYS